MSLRDLFTDVSIDVLIDVWIDVSKSADAVADPHGLVVNPAQRQSRSKIQVTDGSEAHGGHASALRAVGIAAELAGRDAGLEVSGDDLGGLREDAFPGRLRRTAKLAQHAFADVQHGVA